jgi:hypothetical protein
MEEIIIQFSTVCYGCSRLIRKGEKVFKLQSGMYICSIKCGKLNQVCC